MTRSLSRVAGVSVGLAIGGAIVGGTLGAGLLAVLGLVVDGPGGFPYVWDAFALAGAVGVAFGAIGLPTVACGMLRHVARGRVVIETAVGTALGGSLGLLATGLDPLLAAAGAATGFLGAALQLRIRRPGQRPAPALTTDAT